MGTIGTQIFNRNVPLHAIWLWSVLTVTVQFLFSLCFIILPWLSPIGSFITWKWFPIKFHALYNYNICFSDATASWLGREASTHLRVTRVTFCTHCTAQCYWVCCTALLIKLTHVTWLYTFYINRWCTHALITGCFIGLKHKTLLQFQSHGNRAYIFWSEFFFSVGCGTTTQRIF